MTWSELDEFFPQYCFIVSVLACLICLALQRSSLTARLHGRLAVHAEITAGSALLSAIWLLQRFWL